MELKPRGGGADVFDIGDVVRCSSGDMEGTKK